VFFSNYPPQMSVTNTKLITDECKVEINLLTGIEAQVNMSAQNEAMAISKSGWISRKPPIPPCSSQVLTWG